MGRQISYEMKENQNRNEPIKIHQKAMKKRPRDEQKVKLVTKSSK